MTFKKEDEIVAQFTKDEDIKKIVEIIKSKPIKKTEHFYISAIAGRDVSEQFVDETLPQFNKVKVINKREHKKGDIGYDLYYKVSNSTTLLLCFIPKKDKILLINAIIKLRRIENFIKPLNPRF